MPEEDEFKLYSTGWVTKTVYTKEVNDYDVDARTVRETEKTTRWQTVGEVHWEDVGKVANAVAEFHIEEGSHGVWHGRLTTYHLHSHDFDRPHLADLEIREVASGPAGVSDLLDAAFRRIMTIHAMDPGIVEIVTPVEKEG